MEKFIKLFQTNAEYEAYKNGGEMILPNVSLAKDVNKVAYNALYLPIVIAKFNVDSTQAQIKIFNPGMDVDYFSKVEIDDVEMETITSTYVFSTTGEHTVKYTLIDPTTISENLFYLCEKMTSVVIPKTVTTIGKAAFSSCNALVSIEMPNSVTTIGDTVFLSCENLTNVTIPNSVTSIGEGAFYSCESLTSVMIPNSVTTIGTEAFAQCTGLTSVTIGNGITTIGSTILSNCNSMVSLTVKATNPPTLGQHGFFGATTPSGFKIYVPADSVNDYILAWGASFGYEFIIEAIPA